MKNDPLRQRIRAIRRNERRALNKARPKGAARARWKARQI